MKIEVTDKDMLLLQINHALDSRDMERFMLLTNELKGMEVLVLVSRSTTHYALQE